MSTTDNKVKLQLRPTLSGSNPGALNRPDKNPSPSKLMINHGKPNYTISRNVASSTKNKLSGTTEVTSPSSLTTFHQLKPSTISSAALSSPISSIQTSSSNQMEKVVLRHIEINNSNPPSAPSLVLNPKPTTPTTASFVSPGISSKAAATSFGVKLKQCNKKNLQNGGATITNGCSYNNTNTEEEPEFVRRQKQILEKLQHREQQQSESTETIIITNNSTKIENNYQQNGHSISYNFQQQSDEHNYYSQEQNSHVKNVTSRLENVSPNNLNQQQQQQTQQQQQQQQQQPLQQNGGCFKLPPGAICGKPAIPGKPANLQMHSGRIIVHQQNIQNNSVDDSHKIINNSETTATAATTTTTTTTPTTETTLSTLNNINPPQTTSDSIIIDEDICDNSTSGGTNYEQKTVVSFSKDLSTEPNRYPDTVKVTKTVNNNSNNNNNNNNNGNDFILEDDDISDFIAIENATKLAEEMAQLKFDIKTDSEDLTVTPVVIR